MARIRSVKPEIWSSEQILECSRDARLFFIGMWNFCDDQGVHTFTPKTLKAEIFPGDDDVTSDTIRRYVSELVNNGLVGIYEVDGIEYIHCFTFKKHQRIDRPTAKHPKPPSDRALYISRSSSPRRSIPGLFDERSPPEGKGRESRGRESSSAPAPAVAEAAPTVAPAKPTLATEAVALGQAVLEILNRDPSSVMHFGQVHAWLESGFKPEEIRAVAALAAPRLGADIREPLKYLGRFMGEEVQKLRASGGTVIVAPEGATVADRGRHEQWRARCRSFHEKNLWLPQWGPKPGEQGCEVPAEVLAEFELEIPTFLKRSA